MRSPLHNYNDNDTEEQHHWDHLQNTFFSLLMLNDKNTDINQKHL